MHEQEGGTSRDEDNARRGRAARKEEGVAASDGDTMRSARVPSIYAQRSHVLVGPSG